MSDHYHTEVYKGFRIVLSIDSDPQNPRTEWDNLGKMICFHRRYSLGDKHNYSDPDDLFMELCGRLPNRKDHHPVSELLGDGSEFRIVWEPLYLYDHSGITMNTTGFSCQWDSGQVGIIYMTYEDIAKQMNVEWTGPGKWVPSKEIIEQHEKILKGEVETYDTYIRGEVLGFQIYAPDDEAQNVEEDEDPPTEDDDEFWMDDEEDSCWGFFGKDAAIEAAKEAIDAIVDEG